MKRASEVLIATVLIIFCEICSAAQERQITLLRTVGTAEVYYVKDKNKTRAQVRIYLLGKDGDPDTLSMDVIFESAGTKVVSPRYINLAFSSYSSTGPKYKKNPGLNIYTDDMKGFTSRNFGTRRLSSSSSPSGGTREVFVSPPIDYSKFLEILSARRTVIILGKKQFILKQEDVAALNDLNRSIEK